MVEPSTLDQVLEYLREHRIEHYSTIDITKQTSTWDVSINERNSEKILCWFKLSEDPSPALEQYVAENPDLHLQVKRFESV